MSPNPQETEDLVTFTEEILNGKLQFLCILQINKDHNASEILEFQLIWWRLKGTAYYSVNFYMCSRVLIFCWYYEKTSTQVWPWYISSLPGLQN